MGYRFVHILVKSFASCELLKELYIAEEMEEGIGYQILSA